MERSGTWLSGLVIPFYQFKGNSIVFRQPLLPEPPVNRNPKTTIKKTQQNLQLPHSRKGKNHSTLSVLCCAYGFSARGTGK